MVAGQSGRLMPALTYLACALAAPSPSLAAEPAPAGSYARAHYDVFLVENCGLLTAEVLRGFEIAREERRLAEGLDEAGARAARHDAGVAFDLEYQNRGLGGARRWCRLDGKAAALAFFARFIEERYPEP